MATLLYFEHPMHLGIFRGVTAGDSGGEFLTSQALFFFACLDVYLYLFTCFILSIFISFIYSLYYGYICLLVLNY